MTGLDRLWAGWRSTYVNEDAGQERPSLFEGILALPDDDGMVVWRGNRCSALLNAYPYGTGHLMVLPNRRIGDLDALDPDETTELWAAVTDAVRAVRAAYSPGGVNVGLNLGEAAGAGVPDHLHVHVLPRWTADSNFMTAIAETRVLPEPLDVTWRKLRGAWPASEHS